MTEGTQSQHVSHEKAGSMPETFRTLLIAMDLTPISDRVVGRVALLPLAEGARLLLLHVVPKSLPIRAQRRAAESEPGLG